MTAGKLNSYKTIGVIGGMGPTTSHHFYGMIIELFQKRKGARFNYEFPEMIIHNVPSPDNVAAGVDDALSHYLVESCELLEQAGAELITIPCNSAHVHIDEVVRRARVPVLNILEETVKAVREQGLDDILVFGTWSTLHYRLYDRALEQAGINVLLPDEEGRKTLTDIILSVCDGTVTGQTRESLIRLIKQHPKANGVIMGCTELPLVVDPHAMPIPCFDTLEILAEATFEACCNE